MSASKSSKAEAAARARPHASTSFLVDFGSGDPRAEGAGFSEVVFPSFPVERASGDDVTLPTRGPGDAGAASSPT